MTEKNQIERLLSTEQVSARDETLALVEKINHLSEEVEELKQAKTMLHQDLENALGELNILRKKEEIAEETAPMIMKKHTRTGSSHELGTRSRSMTNQTVDFKLQQKDIAIAELRETIHRQEEIIENLKNIGAARDREEFQRDSHMELNEVHPDFKAAQDSYDSPLFPKKYRKYSQQNEPIHHSGFHLRAILEGQSGEIDEERSTRLLNSKRNYDYKDNLTERDQKSELNLKISLPISPAKDTEIKDDHIPEETDHPSLVDLTSVSAHNIETRENRAQTTGINLSLESSMHMVDNNPAEKHMDTPNFNGKLFFSNNFQDNTTKPRVKDDMDNLDSRSEKRVNNFDKGCRTTRQRPSKDQLKAKAAVFTQFIKNFRKAGHRPAKQDYSRDYLDALKREVIVKFLRQVKDSSLLAFSDAVGIYRDFTRKYQYILLVTCRHI